MASLARMYTHQSGHAHASERGVQLFQIPTAQNRSKNLVCTTLPNTQSLAHRFKRDRLRSRAVVFADLKLCLKLLRLTKGQPWSVTYSINQFCGSDSPMA
jgi:hypothetical protein